VDIVPTILDAVGLAIPEEVAGKSLLPLFHNPGSDFREYLFTEYNCDPILYFPSRAVRDKQYKLIYTLLNDRKNPTAVYYTENKTPALEGSPTLQELNTAPDSIKEMYHSWLSPPKIQLYDLARDPWEFQDISSDPNYAAVKERLLEVLFAWQEETNDPLRFPEKLRALTVEHDRLDSWGKKEDWRYPDYLYGKK
jgi:arylsulfatase A-like enzyme